MSTQERKLPDIEVDTPMPPVNPPMESPTSIRKASEAVTALITELRERGVTIELFGIIIPIKIGPAVKASEESHFTPWIAELRRAVANMNKQIDQAEKTTP